MPDHADLQTVSALVARLSPEEQRLLAEMILRNLERHSPPRRRAWHEIRGMLPHPLCEEDAQAWVSRSRQEADEQHNPHQKLTILVVGELEP